MTDHTRNDDTPQQFTPENVESETGKLIREGVTLMQENFARSGGRIKEAEEHIDFDYAKDGVVYEMHICLYMHPAQADAAPNDPHDKPSVVH